MGREDLLGQLNATFDVLVIGGGATGLGTAVDAVTRGYRTVLVEGSDFAKATSSRSTKLVHGGVRYLKQGNVGLVREALRERSNLLRNAPHLVKQLGFICPFYRWSDGPYYYAGLKAYDVLGGQSPFPHSAYLGRRTTIDAVPDLRRSGLRGGVRYYDGVFDDARLALALARTAIDHGAVVLNYVRALRFIHSGERIIGAVVRDEETQREYEIRASVVINATGIFVDELRKLDDPRCAPLLSHSRGSHVVFDREVFRGDDALLVPKTNDGRVLFAVPWHERVLVGTTDTPVSTAELDVCATREDVDFIVSEVNTYLERPVGRKDICAVFAGLRPLVRGNAATTAKLSREHVIEISKNGLLTVTGGKWTTYRKMAADTVDAAASHAGLPRAVCRTENLPLHGSAAHGSPAATGDCLDEGRYAAYGSDREQLAAIEQSEPSSARQLHERLPYTRAAVLFAVRNEMARTVDDILARRTRALFLDSAAAREAASDVATLLADELGRDARWKRAQLTAFTAIVDRDSVALS